jgi:uncharacterized protein YlzI (FlbEa/FlbD family)
MEHRPPETGVIQVDKVGQLREGYRSPGCRCLTGSHEEDFHMFTLTGLDGSEIYIAVESIFRIRASIPADGPPATEVEYGSGYIFTHEPIAVLLARIGTADRFIRLTTRGGSPVYLNVAAISSIRAAPPINAPGTEVIIGGLYQHVMETPGEVQTLMQG